VFFAHGFYFLPQMHTDFHRSESLIHDPALDLDRPTRLSAVVGQALRLPSLSCHVERSRDISHY
jgi:hypothetical protein